MSFLRVFPFLLFTVAAAIGAGSARADDADAVIRITVDQAKLEKAPEGATTLIIGNPSIADVNIIKGGQLMVVTGKGFGQTNLIALDEKGKVIAEKQLRVDPPRSVLVVQRGDSRQSYSCDPWCMPSVQMGDDGAAFGQTAGQIQQHAQLAAGTGGQSVSYTHLTLPTIYSV